MSLFKYNAERNWKNIKHSVMKWVFQKTDQILE